MHSRSGRNGTFTIFSVNVNLVKWIHLCPVLRVFAHSGWDCFCSNLFFVSFAVQSAFSSLLLLRPTVNASAKDASTRGRVNAFVALWHPLQPLESRHCQVLRFITEGCWTNCQLTSGLLGWWPVFLYSSTFFSESLANLSLTHEKKDDASRIRCADRLCTTIYATSPFCTVLLVILMISK